MTPREQRFLGFYERYRTEAQGNSYRTRYETLERAHRQSVTLGSLVLFLSSAVSILSSAVPHLRLWNGYEMAWATLAATLAAMGTAIGAYRALYGFQENAGLYRDADYALAAATADAPDGSLGCDEAADRTPAEYVAEVEQVFRRETGRWGQLVSQIRAQEPEAEEGGAATARRDADSHSSGSGASAQLPRAPGQGRTSPGSRKAAEPGPSTTPDERAGGADEGEPGDAGHEPSSDG